MTAPLDIDSGRRSRIVNRRAEGASIDAIAAAYRLSPDDVVRVLDEFWNEPPTPTKMRKAPTGAAARTTSPKPKAKPKPRVVAEPPSPVERFQQRRRFAPAAQALATRIVADYQAGALITDLAAQYQVDRSRIYKVLDRAGVPRRTRMSAAWHAAEETYAAEIVTRAMAGETISVLADAFDVTEHRISGILDRHHPALQQPQPTSPR